MNIMSLNFLLDCLITLEIELVLLYKQLLKNLKLSPKT